MQQEHPENSKEFPGLQVNLGVESQNSLNSESIKRFKQRKTNPLTVSDYVEGIRNGNRSLLAKAITLVESKLPAHRLIAEQIIEQCIPYTGNSFRIGITGVPGVGKSSFIEVLGSYIVAQGNKLAVLAIDPSSERTKGSILGDKTRMDKLSVNENAFIRPSPSGGSLGGVARKTRETLLLCEAAGYNIIFIETVGVGQSETAVHSMVDFFLLLMLAGAGDELQGIKRGIMEMADTIAITKADGDNMQKALVARANYKNALHLFQAAPSGVTPQVLTCSSFTEDGIEALWENMLSYQNTTKINGYFSNKRADQEKFRMYEAINEALQQKFYNLPEIKQHLNELEAKVISGETDALIAAKKILKMYFEK